MHTASRRDDLEAVLPVNNCLQTAWTFIKKKEKKKEYIMLSRIPELKTSELRVPKAKVFLLNTLKLNKLKLQK